MPWVDDESFVAILFTIVSFGIFVRPTGNARCVTIESVDVFGLTEVNILLGINFVPMEMVDFGAATNEIVAGLVGFVDGIVWYSC